MIKKTVAYLMIITVLSKIFGFLRDITLSFFYGATDISDAYVIATTIPMMLFSFIGEGLAIGYIPIFSDIKNRYGKRASNNYTSNLINIVLVMDTIIIVVCLIFTNVIVKVLALGFQGSTLATTVQFTRITLIGIYFTSLVYVFRGFLQLNNNYIIPGLIAIPLNITIIFSIFLSARFNLFFLAVGNVIAIFTQLLIMLPRIYKSGYKHKFFIDFKSNHIIEMEHIVLPAVLGVSVNQINVLVDKTIASMLAVGGISSLNYAYRLNGFVQGIFILPITAVLFPKLSKMAVKNDTEGFKKFLFIAINVINILVMPAIVGIVVLAKPIVTLLFGRGAFDWQAISMTSSAVIFYSLGMIGFGLREILTRAFYSLKDSKTPMNNGIIALVINIVLNIILSKLLGISGLALATSISAIFCSTLLFVSLRKKIGPFGTKQIFISFLKILFASLIMGLLAKLSFNYLRINIFSQNLSLLIAIGIGALTYFVIIYFMKINDVDVIVNAIKRKLKRVAA